MAEIDLQKAVVQRVQNAVHSLKKELETAGVDVSPVTVEETADGITVTVASTKSRKVYKTDPVVVKPGDDPIFSRHIDETLLVDLADDGLTGDE